MWFICVSKESRISQGSMRTLHIYRSSRSMSHLIVMYAPCNESKYVNFESEVMDDILPVFRKGEEFYYGVEFVLLIAFHASALGSTAEGALASLEKLATEFPNLIVQLTQGRNFNPGSSEFTHAIVIRFRSTEALQLFLDSSEYREIWNLKFQPVIERTVAVQFVVDPVGTELM